LTSREYRELYSFLEERYIFYNQPAFIGSDPVSIPHRFRDKADIEISGFLTATLSWGNRKSILASARRLLHLMGDSPHDFLVHAGTKDFKPFLTFVHRTFNGDDCLFFLSALQVLYRQYGSLEPLFVSMNTQGAAHAIGVFRDAMLAQEHLPRSAKHISNPAAGSAAKRINMFLRWMVRSDDRGVDFGLWKSVDPASLVCPIDVHSGRVARNLGLLRRGANDWKAAEELTAALRQFDPADPVKYDFALFGLGVSEK
jgi:uncharacterized protein (TIGR02757 family)